MKVKELVADLLKLPQENEVQFDTIHQVKIVHYSVDQLPDTKIVVEEAK